MEGRGCHKATSFQKEPAANKPQGFLNQGPDWQPIGCKCHTKKSTNWQFCYAFIGIFWSFLAHWQSFIVVAMPWLCYWSFWRIDGEEAVFHCGLSWIICCWENIFLSLSKKWKKRKKKRTKKLLEPLKSELTIMSNTISTNVSNSSDSRTVAHLLAALQSIKCHNCPKKEKKRKNKRRSDKKSPFGVFFLSVVSCYHLESLIMNLLHFPARDCLSKDACLTESAF